VHNSSLAGSFTPPPSRIVVRLADRAGSGAVVPHQTRLPRATLPWRGARPVVFLLTRFGSQGLRTAWTLPSDFVAPAAFADAVRALERLAGSVATARGHRLGRRLPRHRGLRGERAGGVGGATRGHGAAALSRAGILSVPRGTTFRDRAPLRPRRAVPAQRPVRDSPTRGDERLELRHRSRQHRRLAAGARARPSVRPHRDGVRLDGGRPRAGARRIATALLLV